MGNLLMDGRSPHRLMLVQLCLRDGALAWMERKLHDLTTADKERDFAAKPLSWDDDLRLPFIQAHLGSNTPQLWLAKLKTLVLGKGDTPTPIELDNQFDLIAQHVFPQRIAGDERSELLLATYYGGIVSRSGSKYGGAPDVVRMRPRLILISTLRHCRRTSVQWPARGTPTRCISRLCSRTRRTPQGEQRTDRAGRLQRGGAGRGRGGGHEWRRLRSTAKRSSHGGGRRCWERKARSRPLRTTKASELSAAAGGGQRGGRGDTRTRPEWTEEQVKRYRDKLCFSCGAPYDKDKGCSKSCRNKAPKV